MQRIFHHDETSRTQGKQLTRMVPTEGVEAKHLIYNDLRENA
jgi:hypothetical protein